MKKLLPLFAVAAAQLLSPAHAEGGCPPGQYPQSGQGWQTCVPVPGANIASRQPQGPQWTNNWQAIATDTPLGILGTALDRVTSKDAEQAAVADCKARGGRECIAQISVRNSCVAMAVGESTKVIQDGTTKEAAEHTAMTQCGVHNSKCVVYYSACNFAVRN